MPEVPFYDNISQTHQVRNLIGTKNNSSCHDLVYIVSIATFNIGSFELGLGVIGIIGSIIASS